MSIIHPTTTCTYDEKNILSHVQSIEVGAIHSDFSYELVDGQEVQLALYPREKNHKTQPIRE
jgi:hypothetical protein